MALFSKPYLTVGQQIALLKNRGMLFKDEQDAELCLRRNGYYRLSAYWYPYRQSQPQTGAPPVILDTFVTDTYFEYVRELYVFDKNLKLLLLDAIERIEIAVRVEIAVRIGKGNIYAHHSRHTFNTNFVTPPAATGNFRPRADYDRWLYKYEKCVKRSRTMPFVAHHLTKYGSTCQLPIWIAIELWDFGMMSWCYKGLRRKTREDIAAHFSTPDCDVFESWLRALNYVRNTIAHHGRLWNINLTENPALPGSAVPALAHLTMQDVTRLYSICSILAYLSHVINPDTRWHERLIDHLEKFPQIPVCSVADMGFPDNWQQYSVWK